MVLTREVKINRFISFSASKAKVRRYTLVAPLFFLSAKIFIKINKTTIFCRPINNLMLNAIIVKTDLQ